MSSLALRGHEAIVQAVDRLWARAARPSSLVESAPATVRRLALSFDDGPSPANTELVLDLLEAHGARATFFVVGSRIEGHETILQRAAAGGHELANHTYSHIHTVRLSRGELRAELERTNAAIVAALDGADPRVRLVRPPFGKDRRRIHAAAAALGMTTALWSIDSGDAMYFTTEQVIDTVSGNAAPGAIVLMHDGGLRRDTTLAALDALLPRLVADGYELVTISELLTQPGHR
jgi:peptidoglycan/xylan/chitin deacetylase (PgdA/CDA1 family)